MFCPECGTTSKDGAKFCYNCGYDLTSIGAQDDAPASPARKPSAKKSLPSETDDGFVLVEGGSFRMGSEDNDDERPVHGVTLDSFYICDHPVTQKEYVKVMGNNPSKFEGKERPVECVSWYDAVEYCNALSKMAGLTPCYDIDKDNEDPDNENVSHHAKWTVTCDFTANGYRLPTESEWEFAARGGNESEGYEYSGSDGIDDVAWYAGNSDKETHSVKENEPNELGLYDMSGNVWEWCWDWYGDYPSGSKTNPVGASSGKGRVDRGGCWFNNSGFCRVAYRCCSNPYRRYYFLGFRLVRSAK